MTTKDDIAGFCSYTIRNLNYKLSMKFNIEEYKLNTFKEHWTAGVAVFDAPI